MPTYEYRCEKCGGAFEFRQSMKDPHLAECPPEACLQAEWGHGAVKRQLGRGAGLIFKGSGFYTTDYRSENYKASAKADAPAAPAKTEGSGGSGSSAPTPSAPAAPKPESKPGPAAAPSAPAST